MEFNSVISQIGNTPLVRLKQASEMTGCNIYGKAEYFNPGESVKDRAALFIVKDAIKRKLLFKPDKVFVILHYYPPELASGSGRKISLASFTSIAICESISC